MAEKKQKQKVSMFWYRFAQLAARVMVKMWFKRKFIRNEVKGKKGPFVIIANHQAALDFANLIGVSREHVSFIISSSFFNTNPIKGLLDKAGMIPKQQFQTGVRELKRMRSVIDNGGILGIYPAGLMCEDGLSTPIPVATYKFLQWLKADIYMARTYGTYFVMPKWSKKKRPGKTFLDVYKLFDKDELADMPIAEIKARTDEALLFDAYREQEKYMVKYKGGNNVEGLENVLYKCPLCGEEFSIKVKNTDTLYCEACGYEERCDEYCFLNKTSEVGTEIRYVSDWARHIYDELKREILEGGFTEISAKTSVSMIDYEEREFKNVGNGEIRVTKEHITLIGTVKGEPIELSLQTAAFASLPFSPGKYVELQHGEDIYRCILDDGKLAMKIVNAVKIFYEMAVGEHELR